MRAHEIPEYSDLRFALLRICTDHPLKWFGSGEISSISYFVFVLVNEYLPVFIHLFFVAQHVIVGRNKGRHIHPPIPPDVKLRYFQRLFVLSIFKMQNNSIRSVRFIGCRVQVHRPVIHPKSLCRITKECKASRGLYQYVGVIWVKPDCLP